MRQMLFLRALSGGFSFFFLQCRLQHFGVGIMFTQLLVLSVRRREHFFRFLDGDSSAGVIGIHGKGMLQDVGAEASESRRDLRFPQARHMFHSRDRLVVFLQHGPFQKLPFHGLILPGIRKTVQDSGQLRDPQHGGGLPHFIFPGISCREKSLRFQGRSLRLLPARRFYEQRAVGKSRVDNAVAAP